MGFAVFLIGGLLAHVGRFAAGASVNGLFKVEGIFGGGVSGMSLSVISPTDCNSTAVTDHEGKAMLAVTAAKGFIVHGTNLAGYQDLFIFGFAGAVHFNYTTYMGSRLEAKLLGHLAGLPYNASLGYIILGMDNIRDPVAGLAPSNLVGAAGATAIINGISGQPPFIFEGVDPFPVQTSTITARSTSFVTFPNMVPGVQGLADVKAPKGQHCVVSPGYVGPVRLMQQIESFPDAVSVVSFVCLNDTIVEVGEVTAPDTVHV